MKLPILLRLATWMKTRSLICVTLGLLASVLSASEDLYLQSRWIDGLPLRLAEAGMAELKVKPGTKYIDLTDGFKKLGCSIPDMGYVYYNTGSGTLFRRLDHDNQKIADAIIDRLYRGENLVAICRCYHDLLAPLSAGERLNMIVRIGYVPDPLISGMINRLRTLNHLNWEVDPFDPNPRPPKPITEIDRVQIKSLEKQITGVLDISLHHLKQQLAVLEETKPEAPVPKSP